MANARPPQRATLGRPPALRAVLLTFAVNGLGVGVLGALVPALRDRWDTDARGLGFLLVVTGLAAIAGINVGGRLADARGALRPMQVAMALMGAALLVLPWMPVLPAAMAVALGYGFGNDGMDVSMNAMGVQVEQHRARPVMSRFHALFSVGTFAGSGLVLLLGLLGLGGRTLVVAAMTTAGVLILLAIAAVERMAAQTERISHHVDGVRTAIPRAAWLLGLMAICFGITEGSAMDWSSLHVASVGRVGEAIGAWGLVCVSAFMVAIRLVGDLVVHRVGRRAVVRWGAATAVLGYLVAVVAQPLPLLLIGWSVVGLGVGMIGPQVYGVARNLGGGRGLSVVVTMGYAAFLVGPGVMGSLVQAAGIQQAMLMPLVLAVLLALLAVVMPARDHQAVASDTLA